jgi:hypothetical protein
MFDLEGADAVGWIEGVALIAFQIRHDKCKVRRVRQLFTSDAILRKAIKVRGNGYFLSEPRSTNRDGSKAGAEGQSRWLKRAKWDMEIPLPI